MTEIPAGHSAKTFIGVISVLPKCNASVGFACSIVICELVVIRKIAVGILCFVCFRSDDRDIWLGPP